MNRNIPVQVAYDRTNKGVDIREPSTAFFLIDSADRTDFNKSFVVVPGSSDATLASADFQITKPGQNLITGFFTRMAMTEIELTWSIYNISASAGNNSAVVRVKPTGLPAVPYNITIPEGNYTVKTALDAFVVALNAEMVSAGVGAVFSIVDSGTRKAIEVTAGYGFVFYTSEATPTSPAPLVRTLSQALGMLTYDSLVSPGVVIYLRRVVASDPNLVPYDYIDITCPQLASQQKVKDATTSAFDAIDVVYRWVFANDDANPTTYDSYGYPIVQGYLPFKSRRLLPFPKHIRWDPLLPVGNLDFQTYTDQEKLLKFSSRFERFEFKIQMLLSEV
jgi:hypothetical protein